MKKILTLLLCAGLLSSCTFRQFDGVATGSTPTASPPAPRWAASLAPQSVAYSEAAKATTEVHSSEWWLEA